MPRPKLILDRYRIIDEVGAGGFGAVKHAYDTRLKRDVAIKYIELSQADVARAHLVAMDDQLQNEDTGWKDKEERPDNTQSSDAADAADPFSLVPGLAEARTAAHLNDSNIVTVYDCEVHGSTAYVIMEYVEGKTLEELLEEMGDDITLDVVASVFSSVAHALEVAHDNDVLHLDIKPGNVVVNEKGVVKVADFGLAKLTDASGCATSGGGTIGYMPPEQIQQEALDVRTDEWALASLTYEMLTGSNPFIAPNLREAAKRIEGAELVLPSLCWDSLDRAADDVIFDALDPDPDGRFDTVADFAKELNPLLGSTRVGKKVLAAFVNNEPTFEEPAYVEPEKPKPPVVDRIGSRSAAIIMRIIAVACVTVVAAVSLYNIWTVVSTTYDLATSLFAVFWVALAICIVLTALWPTIGALVAFVLFSAMLLFGNAFIPGLVMLLITLLWWMRFGRGSNGICATALLQPFAGSIGMGALAPITAGTILSVRDAVAGSAFAAVSAILFASLGSGDLMNWDVMDNALKAVNPSISGDAIMNSFVTILTSPATWCIVASWILAAALYALFCRRGSRALGVVGAVVATLILLAGVVLSTGANTLAGTIINQGIDAVSLTGITWLPSPAAFAGVLIPGIIGIILALANVPRRVRQEEKR